MATPSCSHWWHCPIYLAMSITLAAIAISYSKPTLSLSSNASLALQSHGYSSFASLLSLSPQLLSSPQSTFFAIPDKPFSKLNPHPQFLKQLLKYHSVPFHISFSELKNKPQFTCFPTLASNKRIGITKPGSIIEINNVSVSHPDLFLSGSIVVHGVTNPFVPFGEITEPPFCSIPANKSKIENVGQWVKAIRFLSSNGYVSFGIGLSSVLEGVIRENPNLVSATVFAPIDFGFVSSSWGLLDKIVRYHIVPQKLAFADFASFPNKSLLKTLVLYRNLMVNVKSVGTETKLAINGVEIIAPNAFLSSQFVIHGISRALTTEDLPSTSL